MITYCCFVVDSSWRVAGDLLCSGAGRNGDVRRILYRGLRRHMDRRRRLDLLQEMLRQMLLLLAVLQKMQRFVFIIENLFSSLKTLFRSKFLIKLSESMVMSDPRSLMVPGSWSFLVICKRRLSIIIVIDVTNAYQVSGDNRNVLEKQLKFLVKFMIFHNCQWIVALWLL